MIGNDFKCYSRNLKPLPDWKVEQVSEFIPKATKADTVSTYEKERKAEICENCYIILDGEILLMDTNNHKYAQN